MAETEFILEQRNSLGFDVQVKLVDGRELKIISKRSKVEEKYSVDILSLQAKSKEIKYIAWKWVVAGIFSFILAILSMTVLPEYIGDNNALYLKIIMTLITLICVLCLVLFYKRSPIKQIFYSRNAHVPVIELTAGKPTEEIFSNFIGTLEQRINKYQTHMNLSQTKQVVGEMKTLRRLSENGVISKQSYEKAKIKLFKGFS